MRIRRRSFAALLIVLISSLAVPAAVLAAVPVANDDPGTACGGDGPNFGGSFPIPEDYRVAGPFGEWFTLFGDCSLLANDTDADGDPLTYEFVTDPAHGQILKLEPDWFAYQVEPDYSTIAGDQPGGDWVSDSFTYHACDATDCSAPATMHFWIAPINDPPTFTGGPALVEVDEDSGPYSGAWATDVSPGPANESAQTVEFEIVSLNVTGVPHLFAVDPAISSGGVLTFTPGPGQYGLAQVTVRAKDDGGLENYGVSSMLVQPDDTSDQVTFEIVVQPVSDPVVAVDDAYTFDEDSGGHYLDLFANDLDQDHPGSSALQIQALSDPAMGSLAPAPGGVTYTPFADAHGTDTFEYTLSNGVTTDVAEVTVTIDAVEDAPVADDETLTVAEDAGPTAVQVLAGDTDLDGDSLAIASATDPAHGTVAITGGGAGLTYRPDAGFHGPDNFHYVVSDGQGGSDVGTVSVTVTSVNDAPVANDDTLTVPINSGATPVSVRSNDTDIDGDALTITGVTDGVHGNVAVNADGTGLTYKPAAAYHGLDTFTYTISDGVAFDTATVRVTVDPDVAPPVVAVPVERWLSQTVGARTTTARISWGATDAGTGVKSYKLQVSVDGGSWTVIALPTAVTTTTTRALSTGHSYRFRIRATDGAGNTSSYAPGPSLTPVRYSEASARITYLGAWKKTTSPKALGGAARHATASTKRATFRFTGHEVGWIATRTTSSGKARIFIDGVLVGTVDLDRASTAYRKLVFARHFATLAPHTLEIQPVGDGRVDIDGFVILR